MFLARELLAIFYRLTLPVWCESYPYTGETNVVSIY